MRLSSYISNFRTHTRDIFQVNFLWNCPQLNATEPHWCLVNIWFRQWLGAVRQDAIIWTSVDPDACRHMAFLVHNKLRKHGLTSVKNQPLSWKGTDDVCWWQKNHKKRIMEWQYSDMSPSVDQFDNAATNRTSAIRKGRDYVYGKW